MFLTEHFILCIIYTYFYVRESNFHNATCTRAIDFLRMSNNIEPVNVSTGCFRLKWITMIYKDTRVKENIYVDINLQRLGFQNTDSIVVIYVE